MPLPSKKKSPRFGTKKYSHRSKLQLARAAKSKRAETASKPDDYGHAVPGAEGDDLVPRPGPSASHEVIILLLNGQYKYDCLLLFSNFAMHVHFHQCNGNAVLYIIFRRPFLLFISHLVLQMCL